MATSLHHLRAHVLERILELDLLGDGDAVLGDGRASRTSSSITTLRPLGPSVTFTASASVVDAAQDRLTRLLLHAESALPLFTPVFGFTAD